MGGSVLKKIRNVLNTKSGFFVLVLFCFWLKTYLTYQTKFNLGVSGSVQQILLMLNPLPIGILLFGIALYFRGTQVILDYDDC